jgi:hypothetical protein
MSGSDFEIPLAVFLDCATPVNHRDGVVLLCINGGGVEEDKVHCDGPGDQNVAL